MSTVAERTEEEQLLESWLDGQIPCLWKGTLLHPIYEDCPNPATWQLIGTCRHGHETCEQHRAEALSMPLGITCFCGVKTPHSKITWRKL